MLKNPKILILDEATASIDEARESRTLPAILEFMQGKTTLMITHRPEMLKHADKVVQIVEGRVVSVAPPQEFKPMADTPQPEHTPESFPEYLQRPHRPDEPDQEDDRPDARPSGSGIWRGSTACFSPCCSASRHWRR